MKIRGGDCQGVGTGTVSQGTPEGKREAGKKPRRNNCPDKAKLKAWEEREQTLGQLNIKLKESKKELEDLALLSP